MKKKLSILSILILLTIPIFSQNMVSSLMNEIAPENQKDIMQINISGKMLSLTAKNDKDIDAETKELFQSIEKISVAIGLPVNEKLNRQLQKHLVSHEELMSIVENKLDIRMYIKETKGQIAEFVLCAIGDDSMMLMSITGKIDLDKLANLSKNVKIEGMEHLGKIKKEK